jgi:hypothetical protein
MGRRRLIAASAALLAGIATFTLPSLHAQGASNDMRVGVPTVVDPIRGGAEPYISVDRNNQPFVSAPGGTSVQTSWYWRSRDHGLTYQLLGPSTGHWICNSTGGGDSSQVYDPVSNTMYLMDQQALVDIASGQFDANSGQLKSHKCFSDPGFTADRPFEAVLHPTGLITPLQWKQDGGKPMVYMSWQCGNCGGGSPTGVENGGLAYAWSYDGVNWHAADPGVPVDNLVADQFFEAGSITNYDWHGPMVVDPRSGYVFTAISCSPGACPVSTTKNEFGVAVGKPGAGRADASNVGQFASLTYQTAASSVDGQPIKEDGSLFPVIAMDKAGTLYEAWIEGDGVNNSPNKPADPQTWHMYYTYSKDFPNHKVWAPVKRVDLDGPSKANAFGWMTAGDKGKVGFVWLGTTTREQPTKQNPAKKWYTFMSVATNADTPNPTFHEARVGRYPMHIGDICLQGTLCVATVPLGNRNMADFISVSIGPDGALNATYAADANRIAPKPTDTVPGIPVTMTAHQIAGPRLVGTGNVSDSRFATSTAAASPGDAVGDGRFPVPSGVNKPQLDLRGVKITQSGAGLDVSVGVSSLANTTSPSSSKKNVWYLVTWVDKNSKIWFARAESDSGGALTFHAGAPGSYDRPGIMIGTIPTLVDYRGGTAVTGARHGNTIVMHVPASVVGSPTKGDVLESVTGWSAVDNGLPPFNTTLVGNVPTVVDATAAYDVGLAPSTPGSGGSGGQNGGTGSSSGSGSLATTGGPGLLFGLIALALTLSGASMWRRRRRTEA